MKKLFWLEMLFLACSIGQLSAQENVIKACEYWFDENDDARIYKTFDTPAAILNIKDVAINVTGIEFGEHILYLRLQDIRGDWSSILYRRFNHVNEDQPPNKIAALRYWSDVSSVFPTDMTVVSFPETPQELDESLFLKYCDDPATNRRLYFQLQDSRGHWSSVILRDAIKTTPFSADFTINQIGSLLVSPYEIGLQWYVDDLPIPGPEGTSKNLAPPATGNYYATSTNDCGTATSNTIQFVKLASREVDLSGATIYPNPNQGVFVVQPLADTWLPGTIITISNSLGIQVYKSSLEERTSYINLNQPPGIYYVTLNSGSFRATQRIVIF